MKVTFHRKFVKHFDKRVKPDSSLLKRFNERYQLFIENPGNPILHDHKLTGEITGKRSFSITGDIRVVYQMIGDTVEFLDIGTHNQVYK